jgi:hypothetical protein
MRGVETGRTVVKSVPELWSELSETELLGAMLHRFGEIRITRVVAESRVEWASELACGCVKLEPSVFGTRVHLTAELAPAPPPPAPVSPPRRSLLLRLLRRRPAPPGEPTGLAAVARSPLALEPAAAEEALIAVLDEIGAARHRPFPRDLEASRVTP